MTNKQEEAVDEAIKKLGDKLTRLIELNDKLQARMNEVEWEVSCLKKR